jgi:hypothetical protein
LPLIVPPRRAAKPGGIALQTISVSRCLLDLLAVCCGRGVAEVSRPGVLPGGRVTFVTAAFALSSPFALAAVSRAAAKLAATASGERSTGEQSKGEQS